jgi:hypothetical protein
MDTDFIDIPVPGTGNYFYDSKTNFVQCAENGSPGQYLNIYSGILFI